MPDFNLEHITLGTFFAVYTSGLITSLTPCVYPILPIVVGYLGSKDGSLTKRLTASLAYALGMAVVYTALGMAAALTGNLFGAFANNYVYLAFGILMLYMGGSMMDWYYISLPNIPGLASDKIKNSPFIGPLAMGMTSGIVASPCTAPILGSLLLFVATKKQIATGGVLMFTFSLGMSTMLLVIGFFAGSLGVALPKSGGWMVKIKKTLALLIIGAGIYYIYTAGSIAP